MSSYNFSQFAQSFDSFIDYLQLFEASTLSKLDLPDEFIKAVHQKKEHPTKKYDVMGHTYKRGVAIPMPYKHFAPSAEVDVPEPVKLIGRTSNNYPDRFEGLVPDRNNAKEKSIGGDGYTDFAWYLESLPLGPNRVFLVNPDIDFFLYIYDKSRTKGATGFQYAVMGWDPTRKKVIDFGYGELTTNAVDRAVLGPQHDTKGGNTNGKVGQYLSKMAKLAGPGGAPTIKKPIYAYDLGVDITGEREPRSKREERSSTWAEVPRKGTKGGTRLKGKLMSTDFLRIFADRLAKKYPRLNDQMKNTLNRKFELSSGSASQVPAEFEELASIVGGVDASQVYSYLFQEFKNFRQEAFEEGRSRLEGAASSYSRTAGYDLEEENLDLKKYGFTSPSLAYKVVSKPFSPDEERRDPETGYREAQPEKYKRYLPTAGEYASLESLVYEHTLAGLIDKFTGFIFKGRVKFPAQPPLATQMGIKGETEADLFKPASQQEKEKEEDEHFGLF